MITIPTGIGPMHQCDICKGIEGRVLTDSWTGRDICFMCASRGEHGLFYTVTMTPGTDGSDNLDEAIAAAGLGA